MKKKFLNKFDKIVDFIFEAGMLSKTPRSGFQFLGSGRQSVAEHINRVVYIGYTLSKMENKSNEEKVLKLCLFHDLAEARTSDLNYVNQKYVEDDESSAIKDLSKGLLFGSEIEKMMEEYNLKTTLESKIANDADQLELLFSLKEQIDIGNKKASAWVPSLLKRLKTSNAKLLAKKVMATHSDNWWFSIKEDRWWVDRLEK